MRLLHSLIFTCNLSLFPQQHHPATVAVLCSIYGLISLTAFAGNALVIWIIGDIENEREQNFCVRVHTKMVETASDFPDRQEEQNSSVPS